MVLHVVDSCVRGFHVYKDIWTPDTGEVLSCEREDGNPMDPYAVAIQRGSEVIGHVPRLISAACSLFMQRVEPSLVELLTATTRSLLIFHRVA